MRRNCQKRQVLKSSLTGRIGLNINGDLSEKEIVERVKLAEIAGIRTIWVGEFEGFVDPFVVAEIISNASRNLSVGFGILSVSRRSCEEIVEGFEALRQRYGDRYILGLGVGDNAKAFQRLKECVEGVSGCCVVGAGSPGTLKLASKTDGVLYNSVNIEFIRWMDGFVEGDVFKAAYGPALLLPSEFEEDLIIAASIVFLGSKRLISEFKMEDIAEEISEVDIMELVELRRSGRSIRESDDAEKILKHREFLLNNFTISGGVSEVAEEIKKLLEICDHVVLADPFFRDLSSMRMLSILVDMIEGG